MGVFDCLISKKNGKPKSDMEYIYRLDMAWKKNSHNSIPIKIGTIMTNVIQMDNGSYEFTRKETGEILTSTYGWSLAENTEENVIRIELFEKENLKFEEHEKYKNSLLHDIRTLENKAKK